MHMTRPLSRRVVLSSWRKKKREEKEYAKGVCGVGVSALKHGEVKTRKAGVRGGVADNIAEPETGP